MSPIFYTLSQTTINVPELGARVTYGIIGIDTYRCAVAAAVRDVTPNLDLALRMIETFNRCRLSSVHLMDAILDMLE